MLHPKNGDSCRGILKEFLNRRIQVNTSGIGILPMSDFSITGRMPVPHSFSIRTALDHTS